ncbi:flavodoxin family protein [Bacillus lacus]|uniref:Flavodoxin family protein n=1 Tax=Metabacillus lacus TaxID=1983721 RepID=A0A7X2J3K7_9BACI|nr:NAD(P)H-dependent oxidoreductase [Metabacillus lacus]MRX74263.1 flavodoxin family protein [Metabacillus lacus]
MNVLIVYTHPNQHSLCNAFLQEVKRGCEDNESIHNIKILDLYHVKFNPVLEFNEKRRRRDMHIDPEIKEYRDQLSWAEKIVFIYPIWWGRPPAMLLGYIDKGFASGFAYKDHGGLLPEGLLKGKSVVCISTMKGPAFYPLLWLHNSHKVLMKKALFKFVGIGKVKFFEFGSMEDQKKDKQPKFKKVYSYFSKVQ